MPSLNIGAGNSGLGDVRADIRRLPGIDVVCDALHFPFKNHSFDMVYAHHLLEHFTYHDAESLLTEISRVLKAGGTLDLVVPNFASFTVALAWMLQKISRNSQGAEMALPMLSGDQDYSENVHLSLWHPKLLKTYLQRQGFSIEAMTGEFRSRLIPSILKGRATVLQLSCRKNVELTPECLFACHGGLIQ